MVLIDRLPHSAQTQCSVSRCLVIPEVTPNERVVPNGQLVHGNIVRYCTVCCTCVLAGAQRMWQRTWTSVLWECQLMWVVSSIDCPLFVCACVHPVWVWGGCVSACVCVRACVCYQQLCICYQYQCNYYRVYTDPVRFRYQFGNGYKM